MTAARQRWAAATAALLAGAALAECGGAPNRSTAGSTPSQNPTAADRLAALEERLVTAHELALHAQIHSDGAVLSMFEGDLTIAGERVEMKFAGTFSSQPVEMSLTAEGGILQGNANRISFEVQRPPAVAEGLLIGLTRMGLLHNLAVLSTGSPPQGIAGEVRTWVVATDVAATGVAEGPDALSFDIQVDGKVRGKAALWLSPTDGLPIRREQTVHFESGDMHVVESYEFTRFEAGAAAKLGQPGQPAG